MVNHNFRDNTGIIVLGDLTQTVTIIDNDGK